MSQLQTHDSVWFRRVPAGGDWWSADSFHTSVRLSALTGGLKLAVFLHDAGGARSVTLDDLARVGNQTSPRGDGEEYTLYFIRTPNGWRCNGTPVDLREW